MALRDPRAKSAMADHARNPDPTGSRSYGDPTDIAVDVFKQVAKEQLIPQIANRTRNAISVDGRTVFLYQRLRSGRRCACFAGVNTTPSFQCPICYGTGFAGGFLKWGTDLYLFDPSRQWFGVNTEITPGQGLPPWFALEDGMVSGYVEWTEVMEESQYFGIDIWRFEYRKSGGQVDLSFKLEGVDVAFVPFTQAAFLQRLLIAGAGEFRFRVHLKRAVASDPSPLFQYFLLRTLVLGGEPPILTVDIPRRVESNALADFGALEIYQEINMVFSDIVKKINLEDLVIRLFDMTRWKITGTSPNDPQNILTSHDITMRRVFEDEGMRLVIL